MKPSLIAARVGDAFHACAVFVWSGTPPQSYNPWIFGELKVGQACCVTWIPPAAGVLRAIRLETPHGTGITSLRLNGKEMVSGFLDAQQFDPFAPEIDFSLDVKLGDVLELGMQREEL